MKDKFLLSVDIKKIRPDADIKNGCAVAVGSFDGVHVGHRAMIKTLVDESKRLGVPSAVFTFDSDDNPKFGAKLLALPEKKKELLFSLGVDIVLSAPFSTVKLMTASDFAENILFGMLGAKSIVCGYDFRFGNDRKGDVELIKRILSPKGVEVITQSAVCDEGTPVSSTCVRSLISNGGVARANKLLQRKYSFSGTVVSGAKLGRELGFPTINQKIPESLVMPKFGVYAVECLLGGERYSGVANVGVKPTCGDGCQPICETFLFDYSGDCYGSEAETFFVEFIREEKKFSSLSELRSQVERDKLTAKEVLSKGEYDLK